ncbi:hypothetical protein HY988_00035 [Candidatus Micrarchaeota archaeon]|nr:hypothetical protein [Candidatus Micrarchaeota archaeon]
MVIPKKHYRDFIELPDTIAAHLFLVVKKLSAAVRKACKPDAISHLSDDDVSKTGWNLVTHYECDRRDPTASTRHLMARSLRDVGYPSFGHNFPNWIAASGGVFDSIWK